MKTVKIIPAVCKPDEKGNEPKWEGYVVMRMPTFDERFEVMEELSEAAEAKMSELKMIRKLVKASQKFYAEVALKHKESGEECKSFDDMQYHESLYPALGELGRFVTEGNKLGNA